MRTMQVRAVFTKQAAACTDDNSEQSCSLRVSFYNPEKYVFA
jgi:hypothetical protein